MKITVAEAIVLVACIAAPIAAFKLLGSAEAAGVATTVGMVINFMLGRKREEKRDEKGGES